MPDTKTYSGSCHCGQVRFEATADLSQVISCNCSICTKRGLLLAFVGAGDFALLSGGDALADYRFGRKVIHHLFCPSCGVEAFGRGTAPDGAEMVAVNVHCLDGVNVASLTPMPFDGRSL